MITTAANFLGAGTAQTGTANLGILPWATVNNNGTITFATSTVIGASGFIRNLGVGETTGAFVNSFNYTPSSTLVGTWLTTSTTVNTSNTTGLFVGEAVSSLFGTGIPANDFITAISAGTSITLSVATTAAQATPAALTYTTAGTNLNLTSASTGPANTLAQSINSLTLGTGGTLTLNNSNQVITLWAAPWAVRSWLLTRGGMATRLRAALSPRGQRTDRSHAAEPDHQQHDHRRRRRARRGFDQGWARDR